MKLTYRQNSFSPEEVIKSLVLSGQCSSICSEIIKNKEVLKKAKELQLTISDERLQEFADNYRTVLGLQKSGDMMHFLKRNGLTEDDFEQYCEVSLLTASVKSHLANEKAVEEYFINNRSDFDRARLSTISVKEASLADEIIVQVNEEGEDFHKLAVKYSINENTRYSGGYAGFVFRRMLPAEVAAKIFSANAGDILGPFKQEDLVRLILVEEVTKAELNGSITELIQERIFIEWISQFMKDGISIVP